MENPFNGFVRRKSSSSPFVQAGQDLCQIGCRARPSAAVTGGVILPIEIPHGVAPILERLHPRIMHVDMTPIMVSPE